MACASLRMIGRQGMPHLTWLRPYFDSGQLTNRHVNRQVLHGARRTEHGRAVSLEGDRLNSVA
jgi:hypothetical protein